jgi:hypothetical protein
MKAKRNLVVVNENSLNKGDMYYIRYRQPITVRDVNLTTGVNVFLQDNESLSRTG